MPITINGIRISVSQIPGNATKKAVVTLAPTATPRIVRMPSLSGLMTESFTPKRAASKQANIGPNSQGSGICSHKNASTPVRLIRWVMR